MKEHELSPVLVSNNAPATTGAGAADLVAMLLADKRSAATKRAYRGDLVHCFETLGLGAPTPDSVMAFVTLPAGALVQRLNLYKGCMLGEGLAEATVNRRLSAVRSLLNLASRMGVSQTDGRKLVDNERTTAYRDTRGVDVKVMKKLLGLPGTDTLRGRRDTAILRLFLENALRRAEVSGLTVADFEPATRRLLIIGKGRGSQKSPVTISAKLVGAITVYLAQSGHGEQPDAPLFLTLDRTRKGQVAGITPDGLHHLVGEYGKKLGLARLAPHMLRHSAITAALDATNGDVRAVQQLSRHKKLDTLMVYDDSRVDRQGQVSGALSKLL